jgi:hypothetical protein
MAGNVKKKYIAKTGMNFSRLKERRVEAGQLIPDELTDKEIRQLLEQGDIEEVGEKK